MARLARITQKLFGSSAGANQFSKFGSLAAGTPEFTTDPSLMQSLTQFLTGWYGAVVGNKSPPIQDMNTLFYLAFYQLCYLLQAGVPEWDTGTEYFQGDVVNVGGDLFASRTDNNLGNDPSTDVVNWRTSIPVAPEVRFVLEDATVPFEIINGPHQTIKSQTLTRIAMSLFNSGSSGSTVVRLDQYRNGVLVGQALAAVNANGQPITANPTLSAPLVIQAGDLITCNTNQGAENASDLEVYF